MLKRRHASILSLAASALIGLAALSPASAKVLATVNGSDITDEDVRTATEDLGPSMPAQLQGPAREAYVVDYLIDKVLMENLLGSIAKTAITPDAEKKVYDDAAKAQAPETEIHARHILVPTEDEAKAALVRVKKGEDFAKVADEVSKDPGSQGGDLGWFTKDKMVPEFAAAAFKMEPGQVSDPVKSEFGWHVIKVEGKREKSFPPFDQVKDQVARYVAQKAQSDAVMKLREAAKIDRATPPSSAPPGVSPAPGGTSPAPAGTSPAPAGEAPKP